LKVTASPLLFPDDVVSSLSFVPLESLSPEPHAANTTSNTTARSAKCNLLNFFNILIPLFICEFKLLNTITVMVQQKTITITTDTYMLNNHSLQIAYDNISIQ